MSENTVNLDDLLAAPAVADNSVTQEQVEAWLATADKFVVFAALVAKWTPGSTDDKAVVYAQKAVEVARKYAKEPWVLQVVNLLYSLYKKNPAAALDRLKLAFALAAGLHN